MVYRRLQNGSTIVKRVCSLLFLLSIPVVLSGCFALRPPAEITFADGAVVTSLTSNVSLAYTAPNRSISGSGYLMYRRPDQMRVVILSPFGSVLQEIYVSSDRITIIDAGNGVAFSGTYMDLPDKGDLSGWRHIHWLIDIDPPDSSRGTGFIQRINRFGESEKAIFENGLLISKSTASGADVRYSRYSAVHGVAFPLEITYRTDAKETFTILLEDPEVNVPFAAGVFTPDLNKFRVYPLSTLK